MRRSLFVVGWRGVCARDGVGVWVWFPWGWFVGLGGLSSRSSYTGPMGAIGKGSEMDS